MSALLKTSSFILLEPGETDAAWGGEAESYTPLGDPVGGSLSGQQGAPDGSGNIVYSHKLTLDPCELAEDMRVQDTATGEIYAVVAVQRRVTLIPATVAQVVRAIGSP